MVGLLLKGLLCSVTASDILTWSVSMVGISLDEEITCEVDCSRDWDILWFNDWVTWVTLASVVLNIVSKHNH